MKVILNKPLERWDWNQDSRTSDFEKQLDQRKVEVLIDVMLARWGLGPCTQNQAQARSSFPMLKNPPDARQFHWLQHSTAQPLQAPIQHPQRSGEGRKADGPKSSGEGKTVSDRLPGCLADLRAGHMARPQLRRRRPIIAVKR